MAELRELELSAAQRGMVLGHLLDASGYAYNIGQYEAIEGPLDVDRFIEAARYVVAHTEALRTRIVLTEKGYVQQIEPNDSYRLPVIDLSGSADPEAEAQALQQQLVSAPFDLSGGPLVRWALVKLGHDRWQDVIIAHHAVFDGLSGLLWVQRTAQVYTALTLGEPLPVYAVGEVATLLAQETAYRASSYQERGGQYWQQLLAGCEPSPAWSGRLLGKSRNSVRQTLVLPASLTAPLRVQARCLETTVGQLVTAASALLQCLHGRSNSCVLGLPVLGRRGRAARLIPGMTSNVVHLRLDCGPQLTVAELVAAVGRQFDAALRHQRYDSVQLRRDLGLRPEDPDLYSLSVNLMPFDHALRFADAPSQNHNLANGPEQGLGLMVYDEPGQPELRLDLNGNTDLYTQEELARYLTQLQQVLAQLGSASADAQLARIELVSPVESEALARFNATDHALDASLLLPDLFAAQVIKTPEAIALVFEDTALTYAELDARSSQLARHLISLGAGPEVRIAIGLERSVELVVAILSVLKSGAAYVPLDPEYPIDRLSYMLANSAASLVITMRDLAERLTTGAVAAGAQQVLLDDPAVLGAIEALSSAPVTDADRPAALHSQNLAYLIYTSGSTGRPKAVAVTQAGLVHYLGWAQSSYAPASGRGTALNLSVSFDASVTQLYLPLLSGTALHLLRPGDEVQGLQDLLQGTTDLSFIKMTPAVFAVLSGTLSSEQMQSAAPVIVLGGEALDPLVCARWRAAAPDARLVNEYGPTEAVVGCVVYEIDGGEGGSIPIGTPIWNTQIHVLDAALRSVPIGVWGELYIAGAGLARGYVNRSALTAERFIASPFSSDGARMYRSGDLARWTNAGILEFGGRVDEQVKIRGFRIEPGEIAAALSSIEGVAQAAVVVREVAGERRLIAYLTPQAAGSIPEASALRQRLSQSLPEYMIPSAFMTIDALPLTSSGKLDRRALPSPEISGDSAYVPPETASEILLCRLFAELTGAKEVSVDDNFFSLGGHSLLAMRLVTQLREALGISLPLRSVFEASTARTLAARLDAVLGGGYKPLLVLRATGAGAALFCVHHGGGWGLEYRSLLPYLDVDTPVYSLQAQGVEDVAAFHASVEEMAACYIESIREIQPHGPYRLLGWSFGGTVAHEMARQWEAQGESVALLVIMDTMFESIAGSEGEDAAGASIATDESAYQARQELARLGRVDVHALEVPMLQRMIAFLKHVKRLVSLRALYRVRAPILYFRAAGNEISLYEQLARVTAGAIEIIDIDAAHGEMLNPESAVIIAEHLNRVLSRLPPVAPVSGQ